MASERWATIVLSVDGSPSATWELTGTGRPTIATVDALARVHLDARRLGWDLVITGPTRELAELIELAGLAAVVAA